MSPASVLTCIHALEGAICLYTEQVPFSTVPQLIGICLCLVACPPYSLIRRWPCQILQSPCRPVLLHPPASSNARMTVRRKPLFHAQSASVCCVRSVIQAFTLIVCLLPHGACCCLPCPAWHAAAPVLMASDHSYWFFSLCFCRLVVVPLPQRS